MITEFDKLMMQEAIKLALIAEERDEVPVGAVITHHRRIVAKAYNQVEMLKDPTAHAEMIAITQASNTLKAKWLQECTLYVTIEPCSMCAGALVLARMKRLCFGADDLKTGACGSVFDIVQSKTLNHRVEVVKGILKEDCAYLISNFFTKKRKSQALLNN